MDRSKRLGEASVPRLLATFSLPAIVGMLAQAMHNVVDQVFVGHALGPNGIAGITVARPYMLVLVALGMLVGFGATALVSMRLGEHKRNEAEQVLGNAVSLLLAVSVVTTIISLAFLNPLLRLFGASDNVFPYAHDCLGIIVLGSVFQVCGFGLNAVIRGEGNPRVAMLTLLIGVFLNVVLAPLFIFGFGWGMKGAGLATVLSQAVSATWVFAYFLGGDGQEVRQGYCCSCPPFSLLPKFPLFFFPRILGKTLSCFPSCGPRGSERRSWTMWPRMSARRRHWPRSVKPAGRFAGSPRAVVCGVWRCPAVGGRWRRRRNSENRIRRG